MKTVTLSISNIPTSTQAFLAEQGWTIADVAAWLAEGDFLAVSAALEVDPTAAINAMLNTPSALEALAAGATEEAFGEIGGAKGIEDHMAGLPEAGEDKMEQAASGDQSTLFEGDGWHTDTGKPNYQTAQPGDIVYDSNGKEAGVMTENGIDLWLDGTDEDGDGKADYAVDEDGTIYLWPEEGHNPEPEQEGEPEDGTGKTPEDDGDSPEPEDTTPEDGEETPAEEDDAPAGGSDDAAIPAGGEDGLGGCDGGEDGADIPDDFEFRTPGDDGTTQPGPDTYEVEVELVLHGPTYGLTQPAQGDGEFTGGVVVEPVDPTYGTTQPDPIDDFIF